MKNLIYLEGFASVSSTLDDSLRDFFEDCSSSSVTAFLNTRILLPSEALTCGSRLAPKRSNTISRITSHSQPLGKPNSSPSHSLGLQQGYHIIQYVDEQRVQG